MLTRKQTQLLIDQYQFRPKKTLGQNFLVDKNILQKILQEAAVHTDDKVIEVGPGFGTLSLALLQQGVALYSIEKDPVLYRYLMSLEIPFWEKWHLILGDALENPLAGYTENLPFKIVANLPYAITTPWLARILQLPLAYSMTLLLQKETAQRLLAAPKTKNMSPISIFLQSAYRLKSQHKVSASCFYPIPKVGSQLIHLEKIDDPFLFSPSVQTIIRNLFLNRRKQIAPMAEKLLGKPTFQTWQTQAQFNSQSRPEELSIKAWQILAKIFS